MITENLTKKKIAEGKPILMAFLTTHDTATAEMMAMSNIDLIVVDNEHMPYDDQQIVNICRAVAMHGKACLIRTPIKDAESLSRFMEFGISGICATQCHGLEDAQMIINAVKYPPIGKRGLGNDGRACGYGFMGGMSNAEYMKFANDNTMIFVTLEDEEAIADAKSIASLKEIDSVHIGPIDLSSSMGFGGNPNNKEVVKVIHEANRAIIEAGNMIGQFAPTPESVPKLIEEGARCLIIPTDLALLRGVYTAYSHKIYEEL